MSSPVLQIYRAQLWAKTILAIVLIAVTLDGYFYLRRILAHVERTTLTLDRFAERQDRFIAKQERLFDSEGTQRSIGLFLRSGDNLYRVIERLNKLLTILEQRTLPLTNDVLVTTNGTIKQADATLAEAEAFLGALSRELGLTIAETRALLVESRRLIGDPKIAEIMVKVGENLDGSRELLGEMRLTAQEARLYLPQLMQEILRIAKGSAETSEGVAQFVGALNRPVSKKERAFRFILDGMLRALPYLLVN